MMPQPREMLEDTAHRRRVESRLANRDKRHDLVLTALKCIFWAAAGLALVGWGFHTTVTWLGEAAFWTGLAVGNAGILFTLLAAYRRGD